MSFRQPLTVSALTSNTVDRKGGFPKGAATFSELSKAAAPNESNPDPQDLESRAPTWHPKDQSN